MNLFNLDRIPELNHRARAAVDRLIGQNRRLACRHLHDAPTAIICAEHPGAGLMCSSCADNHTSRHPRSVEWLCDECGQIEAGDHMVSIVTSPAEPVTLTARIPRSGPVRFTGHVTVGCLGLCPSCADAYELDPFEGAAK